MKCPSLNAPLHGNLIGVPANTEAIVGTVAEFMCPVGTRVNSSNVIVCQNDGTWSGPKPSCNLLGVFLLFYTVGNVSMLNMELVFYRCVTLSAKICYIHTFQYFKKIPVLNIPSRKTTLLCCID